MPHAVDATSGERDDREQSTCDKRRRWELAASVADNSEVLHVVDEQEGNCCSRDGVVDDHENVHEEPRPHFADIRIDHEVHLNASPCYNHHNAANVAHQQSEHHRHRHADTAEEPKVTRLEEQQQCLIPQRARSRNRNRNPKYQRQDRCDSPHTH